MSELADVLPINCPSRAVLWRRLQLIKSLVSHRPLDPATKTDLLQALCGVHDDLDELDGGGGR